jgi:hypothetical protein
MLGHMIAGSKRGFLVRDGDIGADQIMLGKIGKPVGASFRLERDCGVGRIQAMLGDPGAVNER